MEALNNSDLESNSAAGAAPGAQPLGTSPLPSAAKPELPVLNVEGALSRLGGDQELLRDMAGFYLEDTGQLLDDLEDGLQKLEGVRAARRAHSLKGLSANFNAEPCAAVAFAVEVACTKGDLATATKLLPNLRSEVARLIVVLRREILHQ